VLGADPERLRWGIDHVRAARVRAGLDPATIRIGATVYIAPHPNLEVARELSSGRVASNARWLLTTPGPPAGTGGESIFAEVTRRYDMNSHTFGSSPQTAVLTPEIIDNMSVSGPPDYCVARLRELVGLGLDHLWITTYWRGSDPAVQAYSQGLLFDEVLPHLL
jgi:alkanesulfonate monooxygenase SsuD/methylene tetrahydromethanopterin reductase-like flavin-dependent oxidoreductase (luciferase family)